MWAGAVRSPTDTINPMDSEISLSGVSRYESRISSEIDIYRDCIDVHNLPPIFHYWSNRHVRPMLERHGFSDPAGLFQMAFENQCAKYAGKALSFLSVGSGNCDLEIKIAARLRATGYSDFVIECLDLNPAMLERGAARANDIGVAGNLEFVETDLNRWVAAREYHAVMADQSLHHVLELEWLFGQITRSLRPDGVFVISDMIGRNGHLRWPEALAIVQEFWKKLPPAYRFNCRSTRYEALFEDADCSTESFEGIRAQDILPLLTERFHFQSFLGFGNVIDPFVDRSFGPNFDPASAWDREFIDQVHRRDEEEIAAGRLKPTHMLAILGKGADAISTPAAPVQSRRSAPAEPKKSGYEWASWPHTAQSQLESVCRILENTENRLRSAIAEMQQREIEFQERTAWALQLDRRLKAAELALVENEQELLARAVWAGRLQAELADRTAWALRLDAELTERTDWALRLNRQLTTMMHQTLWRRLELGRRLRAPFRLAGRWLRTTRC